MHKIIQQMMSGAIDFAGLFPPAELGMDSAITQYANYRTLDDAWMLGRFICPASRLRELDAYKNSLFETDEPFRFSVLGSGGKDAKQFAARLAKDVADINTFLAFHENRVAMEVYETRLPDALIAKPDVATLQSLIEENALALAKTSHSAVIPFYEITLTSNWREALSTTIRAITAFNLSLKDSDGDAPIAQRAGFKIRCGGVEPQMYPDAEQIATVINTCLRFNVPLKATAGLHHPVRHFNAAAGVKMHGFLNVIGAMVLADVHGLDTGEIEEIIADEDAGNFIFTRRAFAWQGMRASESDIRKNRENGFTSFGSCSFDEPREDLAALNLL
ncbi:MAG: hypothetical protein R3C41_07325 [Calditrichia bacterium]